MLRWQRVNGSRKLFQEYQPQSNSNNADLVNCNSCVFQKKSCFLLVVSISPFYSLSQPKKIIKSKQNLNFNLNRLKPHEATNAFSKSLFEWPGWWPASVAGAAHAASCDRLSPGRFTRQQLDLHIEGLQSRASTTWSSKGFLRRFKMKIFQESNMKRNMKRNMK